MLSKDLIEQPQIWNLVLEISAQAIEVVAFSPYEDHSLIHEHIALANDEENHLKAVEDAIYDNPLLLSDFKSTTVLYDTKRFITIPSETLPLATTLLRKVFPTNSDDPTTVLTSNIPSLSMAIAFDVPNKMLGFLRRTFQHLTICHPLAPQAAWLRSKYPGGNKGKTLINLRHNRLDIAVLGDRTPLLVNTFSIKTPMDALYYVMAARHLNSLDADDEIFIAGDRELRTAVSALLREYVKFVMPAIFPSVMFRAGKASLGSPFEMILTPVVSDLIEHGE